MSKTKNRTYAVGDRVHIKDSEVDAVVLDRVISQITGKVMYTLESEDFDGDYSDTLFMPEDLEPTHGEEDRKDLDIRFEFASDIVIARLYRGGKQICYGHARIIHEGIVGFVQAASYAVKRIYEQMADLDSKE